MTLADKIKVLDDKIKANEAQYNLDREADKQLMIQSRNMMRLGRSQQDKVMIIQQDVC